MQFVRSWLKWPKTQKLETKMIDWEKPVETVDGRAVRVLCTDRDDKYCVVGLLENLVMLAWDADGKHPINKSYNLRNIKEKLILWFGVYIDRAKGRPYVGPSWHSESAVRNQPLPAGVTLLRVEKLEIAI